VDLGSGREGLAVDIGEDGIGLQTFAPLQVGQSSAVRFLISGSAFEGTAIVAWVGPGRRSGIKFENIPEASRALLKEWLATKPSPDVQVPRVERSTASVPSPQTPADVARLPNTEAEQLDVQSALDLILERVLSITGADGAAIAVGNATEMCCCASLGNAPDIGTSVSVNAGLSGVCLRTSELVQCDDAEADPRIDPTASRELNLRSVLILPVLSEGVPIALLEVFSSKPGAFSMRHGERLSRIVQLLPAVLSDMPAGNSWSNTGHHGAGSPPETFLQDAPPTSYAENSVLPVGVDGPKTPPVTTRIDPETVEHAALMPQGRECDICGHRNPPSAIDCERCQVMLPGALNSLCKVRESMNSVEPATAMLSPVTGIVSSPPPNALVVRKSRSWLYLGITAAIVALLACMLAIGLYVGHTP
jgi:hypothetical protein